MCCRGGGALASSVDCPEGSARHLNGEGCVASTAQVSPKAFIGKNAKVLGNAFVGGGATITDEGVVSGDAMVRAGTVSGDAEVRGNARMFHGLVTGEALVGGYAILRGHTTVVEGHATFAPLRSDPVVKRLLKGVTLDGSGDGNHPGCSAN